MQQICVQPIFVLPLISLFFSRGKKYEKVKIKFSWKIRGNFFKKEYKGPRTRLLFIFIFLIYNMPRRPKVYLRIRPAIRLEEENDIPLFLVDKENQIVKYQKHVGNLADYTDAQARFDIVFDSCSQEEVFNQLWDEIFTGFLDGISTSIVLYGATGSGKTYTM